MVSFVTFSVHLNAHFLSRGPFLTAYPISLVRHISLKALPVGLPVRPWPVAIVTLKNRTLSPAVERFIECAREVAKSIFVQPHARKS
jgi:DNA-binding transcriptional LysR family regulator